MRSEKTQLTSPTTRAEFERRIGELSKLVESAQSVGDVAAIETLVDEIDALTDEFLLQEARRDPNAFIEYCFTDKSGRPLQQSAIHRQWQSSLYHRDWNPGGSRRAIIVAPRDHGKTTQIPVGRVLWELGVNPNLRIKIACQSDSKAMERLFEITDHLERNEKVHRVFPHLKPAQRGDWTKHKIVVNRTVFSKDASIEALGILSTATGGRADLLIADDIVDRRNAIQFPQIRETIKHAWKSDWTNLLEPDGRVAYICTLWHTADNSHELMENQAYSVLFHAVSPDFKQLEAWRKDRGNRTRIEWAEPLWDHWSESALVERKEEIGQTEFDRAFRNVALSGEVAVVHETMVQWFDPSKLSDLLVPFQAYDLAISKKAHADFFASVTVCADLESGKVFVMDAYHAKLSFTQQAEAIINDYLAWEPDEQVIEVVSYQDSLPQYLDAIVGKPIEELETIEGNGTTLQIVKPVARIPQLPITKSRPKLDKMSRLKRVTPYLERGLVLFHPKLNPRSTGFVAERGDLVTELLQFPLARNDDLADAFINAVLAAFRALSTRDGDVDDGPELDCNVRVLGAI